MPFNPAEPNAQLYGIMPQYYAASLAAKTGDRTADAINALNLGDHARGASGLRGYEDLIRQANEMGYRAEMGSQQKDRDVAYLNNVAALIKAGAARGIRPGEATQLQFDPTVVAEADAAALQAQQAENVSKVGSGVQGMAAGDLRPNLDYLAGILTPPQATAPTPAPTVAPTVDSQAKMINAEANREEAKYAGVRAKNSGGGGRDYTEYEEVWDPINKKMVTTAKRRVYGGGGGNAAPAPAVTPAQPRTKMGPNGQVQVLQADGTYK